MKVTPLTIDAVKLIVPRKFSDPRGHFVETWNRRALAEAGIDIDFVQDNASLSRLPGTIRGLHFQTLPMAQAKLVRVVRGSVFDVAVDIRRASPTFGRSVSAELTAEGGEQLWIPRGFAHAYCTITADCEIFYKADGPYAPDSEGGIAGNDPDLAIPWPLDGDPVLSPKDTALPRLKDLGPVAF